MPTELRWALYNLFFMNIAGLQKLSLIDYPDKISATIFIWGCSFRCSFCHNPELVKKELQPEGISEEEFISFLKKRKGLLEAVTITGGEPLLYPDIVGLIKKIKKLGFLVKIDTNGSNPELLKRVIDLKLSDYIAMDIKAPLEKYEKVTCVKVDPEKIKQSIKLIMDSGLTHEFRTTLLPSLHTKDDVVAMAKLIKGARKYCLQGFVNKGKLMDESLSGEVGYTSEEMQKMAVECKKFVQECIVR